MILVHSGFRQIPLFHFSCVSSYRHWYTPANNTHSRFIGEKSNKSSHLRWALALRATGLSVSSRILSCVLPSLNKVKSINQQTSATLLKPFAPKILLANQNADATIHHMWKHSPTNPSADTILKFHMPWAQNRQYYFLFCTMRIRFLLHSTARKPLCLWNKFKFSSFVSDCKSRMSTRLEKLRRFMLSFCHTNFTTPSNELGRL